MLSTQKTAQSSYLHVDNNVRKCLYLTPNLHIYAAHTAWNNPANVRCRQTQPFKDEISRQDKPLPRLNSTKHKLQ